MGQADLCYIIYSSYRLTHAGSILHKLLVILSFVVNDTGKSNDNHKDDHCSKQTSCTNEYSTNGYWSICKIIIDQLVLLQIACCIPVTVVVSPIVVFKVNSLEALWP